ncbi:MAG TPA: hypothetical protein VH083_20870 [Myxococcales bacterium]|nr:hypothetical protein [Myxococcales bacterium]
MIAAVSALAFGLPVIAEILGMQVAGTAWNALRSSSPYLSQAGELCGGLLGGLLLGAIAFKLIARTKLWPWPLAGLLVGAVYSVYPSGALLAAPIAAGAAGFFDKLPQRWMTGLSIGGALAAMAHALPFPHWAVLALCLASALACGWGFTS